MSLTGFEWERVPLLVLAIPQAFHLGRVGGLGKGERGGGAGRLLGPLSLFSDLDIATQRLEHQGILSFFLSFLQNNSSYKIA